MKTKNLLISCVWIALTIVFVVLMVLGSGYSNNPTQWLIWTFQDFFNIFIIAIIFTGAVLIIPEKTKVDPNLLTDLQTIRSKLDELTVEVNQVKKILEE